MCYLKSVFNKNVRKYLYNKCNLNTYCVGGRPAEDIIYKHDCNITRSR